MLISNQEKIKELIKAIVSYVSYIGGYVTKTKLIKYLYIIDIEYYRKKGEIYTKFNWIFFKYGPWTKEFEDIYVKMITNGELIRRPGTRVDLETEFLSTDEKKELGEIFHDIEEKALVETILDRWADEPLGKMLDYVYFYTEPMESVERGKLLDFSKIERLLKEEKVEVETENIQISKKKLIEIKSKLFHLLENLHKRNERYYYSTPPQYDEMFWETIDRMAEDDEY